VVPRAGLEVDRKNNLIENYVYSFYRLSTVQTGICTVISLRCRWLIGLLWQVPGSNLSSGIDANNVHR